MTVQSVCETSSLYLVSISVSFQYQHILIYVGFEHVAFRIKYDVEEKNCIINMVLLEKMYPFYLNYL
jgi:hypothetical protein